MRTCTSAIDILICLRHLLRLSAVTNSTFIAEKKLAILQTCATCSELPSNIIAMTANIKRQIKQQTKDLNSKYAKKYTIIFVVVVYYLKKKYIYIYMSFFHSFTVYFAYSFIV